MHGFVDTHSHMVPSGDDGVRSVEEGLELVLAAGRHGTAVLYATPHVMVRHPVTAARRRQVATARDEMRRALGGRVELRVGWEISPEAWFLETEPADLRMEGLDACLLELPLPHTRPSSLEMFVRCAEHIEGAGLVPIVGHPERCDLLVDDLRQVDGFRERGWLMQVNASSLTGRHGRASHAAGWRLVEDGRCDLVGSDGHRRERPPFLDEAFRAVSGRIGHERAMPLFDGTALEPLAAGRAPHAGRL
ncbi:MAG: CpsB/CapC family capsule biosynthesis tyrosine phosphatase [Solirubrobacteraceae bacterium]